MAIELATVRAASVAALRDAGVANPHADVEWLIADACGVSRGALVSMRTLTPLQFKRFEASLQRRVAREPLQHILGVAGFRYLELAVGPGVFVPRPETELLVDLALSELSEIASDGQLRRVVDLCTGSGAIALAIATEAPGVDVLAVEVDEAAAAWARRNIASHAATVAAAGSKVVLEVADARDGQQPGLSSWHRLVDVVTCNPPYIPDDAIPRDAEVREFDPAIALFGGPDGLAVVREIVDVASQLLRPGGLLLVEHGDAQGEGAAEAGVPYTIRASGSFTSVADHQDLTDRPRVTTAQRRG